MNMAEWDKVYSKWKSIEDEKAEKIKNKKEEKRKAEMVEASFKPRISKTSEKMVNNREDIVERMVTRKAETDKKLANLRKLQDDMLMSSVKKIPTINQKSHALQRPEGVMEQWVRERDKKLDAMRTRQKEQEEEEMKEYFKPKVNAKSVDMLSKKEEEQQDVTVRLSEKIKKRSEKLEEMRKSSELSHKPQINSRSKAIKLTTPVHERLYKVGMNSIIEKHKFMVDNWDFSFTTRKPLGLEVEPNTMEEGQSIESPNELHNSLEPPFGEEEEEDLANYDPAGADYTDDVANYNLDPNNDAGYNGVNWPHAHVAPFDPNSAEYANVNWAHPQMANYNNPDYNHVVWQQQHQNYVAENGGDFQRVEAEQNGGHMHGYQDAYDQLVEEDLELYYQAAANSSGYDEDLQRMMMEAGFFQTSHAVNLGNERDYQ